MRKGKDAIDQKMARDAAPALLRDAAMWHAPQLRAVLDEVICERHKQEVRHKERSIARTGDLAIALAALGEEFGELSTAILLTLITRRDGASGEDRAEIRSNLRYEAIQVAAVAIALVEAYTP